MPHDTPLITTIVAALVLAFIFGAIANRLKMPPLVGYLLAGVAVGPHSPGFVADQTLASQLAEIGVILLMFGVGLEFSLRDLLSVKAVAIPGALIRMVLATGLGVALASVMGWPLLGGVVFGLALAVSSTVVTLKALQDRHLVDSDRGHIAMGWLVVEDLAMVLALVLIPALAAAGVGGGAITGAVKAATDAAQQDAFVNLAEQLLHIKLNLWEVIGLTLLKLLAFVGFMVIVGRRLIPMLLHATAHTGSRELFRLAVLAIALGVAAGAAYLFGVSLALGAFFAGMILSESELSHRAAQETLPLRDAFGVLFFVSVGMLFDPSILLNDLPMVLATLAIIMIGKSLIGFVLLLIFRRPVATALTISAALAQIGEFSFILVALGVGLGVIPEEARSLVLTGAIISIVLNPLSFWFVERLRNRMEARVPRRSDGVLGPVVPDGTETAAEAEPARPTGVLEEVARPTQLSDHVVLIGYGRVGTVVAGELLEEGAPLLLIEDAEGRVRAAREQGIEVIVGNAATGETLRLANVMGARCVVIAIPNAFEAGQAVEQCRKLNSAVRIIARAHADEEIGYLGKLGADKVIMGEREIGLGMIDWLKGQGRTEPRSAPLATGENLLQQAREAQPAARREPAPLSDDPFAAMAEAAEDIPPVPQSLPLPRSLRERDATVPALRPVEPPLLRVEPILPPVSTSLVAPAIVPPVAPVVAETPATYPLVRREPAFSLPDPVIAPPAPAADPMADVAFDDATVSDIAADVEPMVEAEPTIEPDPQPAAWLLAGSTPPQLADDEAPEVESRPASPAPAPAPFSLGVAVAAAAAGAVFRTTGLSSSTAEPAPATDAEADWVALTEAARSAADAAAPHTDAEPPVDPGFADEPVAVPQTGEVEPASPSADPDPAETLRAPSPGFRVVPAADIFILPPEPRPSTGQPSEPAAPVFRSEFWDEPDTTRTDGPEFSTSGTPTPPLREVHEVAAARAAVEEGSWLEALERDLFGDGGALSNTAEANGAEAAVESRRPTTLAQPVAVTGKPDRAEE